jgi:hypothetical protein
MRRFLTLICLLCLAIPAGISISGCTRNPGENYCNGLGYGMKVTDVAVITLPPVTGGISMAFGQTRQVAIPSAMTCKGGAASSVTSFNYGTTNNQLVDISPSGNICAGTWNRNSGGGISNYTICNPPNPLPTTGGLPYSVAYVTASAQSVVSNPVQVYVHSQVTSVSLALPTPPSGKQQCYSQGVQSTLDGQACFAGANNQQQVLCAPASVVTSGNYACPGGVPAGVTSIPSCTAALGSLNYSVGIPAIATITTNTNSNLVTITAGTPGTTPITASIAGSGSMAGYYSVCPPASISVALANGSTSGTVTQGVTQNLTTTVLDTMGNPITGLNLDYQSTDPVDISTGTAGSITTSFPGVASIYAICQPSSCNPAPVAELGIFGTGLPISSNKVTVTTPGTASEYLWFAAPGQSEYIVPIELLTGIVGAPSRLPNVPNSMIMDRLGNDLYLGSYRGVMIFNTASGTVTKQDASVPGVVLAVSPDNQTLLINDQQRQLFYLYGPSTGSSSSIGGMGNAAVWTPDTKTLYVTDNAALNNPAEGISGHTDMLYVFNQNTGWTTHPLPPSPLSSSLPPGIFPGNPLPANPLPPNVAISSTQQTPALTIPSVGAFVRGSSTEDHTWCPTGTAGNYSSMTFYPKVDSIAAQSDVLVATTDGQHILGAAVLGGAVTLNDIGVSIPTTACAVTTTGTAPNQVQTLNALSTNPWSNTATAITLDPSKVNASAINQLITAPNSSLAFITYTAAGSNTNAQLPYYLPNSSATTSSKAAPGTVGYLSLQGSASSRRWPASSGQTTSSSTSPRPATTKSTTSAFPPPSALQRHLRIRSRSLPTCRPVRQSHQAVSTPAARTLAPAASPSFQPRPSPSSRALLRKSSSQFTVVSSQHRRPALRRPSVLEHFRIYRNPPRPIHSAYSSGMGGISTKLRSALFPKTL